MSFEFIKKLPIPAEIKKAYPVSDYVAQIKQRVTPKSRMYLPGTLTNLS